MSDVLIVVIFFALLVTGFVCLKISATRSIERYIREKTPEVDFRVEKRKRRIADLKDWDYDFAALQVACKKKREML